MGTFSNTNDVVNIDSLPGTLADNGRNVATHLLMPNSPAINSGINANATDPTSNAPLMTDTRGAADFQELVI